MKKICAILLAVLSLILLAKPLEANGEVAVNEYLVSTYAELSSAVAKSSNSVETKIIVNGKINIEKDLTIKGRVTFVGASGSTLVFENGSKKTTIYNSKNSDIRFENLTIARTVTDETEGFLFRFHESGVALFTEVTFDVAVLEGGASTNFDRITYAPTGTDITLYFNACTFNTEAYFYRGTMVFFNNEAAPSTAGSPTIRNFNELKIDYNTRTITYPANIKVGKDADMVKILKSGATFESLTTYYASKDGFTFAFTTKNLKFETPTLASIDVDYEKEVVNFTDNFLVSKNAEFTDLLSSGDKVEPGMKLYIKQLAEGIFIESDACEVTLPNRPVAVDLDVDFVCSFGFVMKYYENTEYSIGEEYQLSPVFINLESNTTYTVKVRLKATDSSFASIPYEVTVKTTE